MQAQSASTNTSSIPTSNHRDQGIIQILNEVKSGNYRARINGQSALEKSIDSLIELLEKQTGGSLDRLVKFSIKASDSSIVSSRVMQRLQDTDQRSHAIAETVTLLETSIDSINGFGRAIVSDVAATRQSVKESVMAADETIQTMEEISGVVHQTLEKVKSLEKLSKEISDVSDTIKSIAFQTNLLSLNANVEAAKAGEAGRGFGVVAKEVGSLASRSADATKAIEEMVRSTQSEIADIMSSMDASTKAVSSGRLTIESLESSIRSAEKRVAEVEHCADQITGVLREQTSAVTEVGQGIRCIAEDTEVSVAGVSQVVSAMGQLDSVVEGGLNGMSQVDVKNKILKLAQSDHVTWKKRLIQMVVGIERISSHELSDHQGCRLGQWYDSVTDPVLKESDAFKYLIEPHRAVHAHGKRAVDYYNRGNIESAMAEIEQVEQASEEVLSVLKYLDSTQ